jgi:hypothetical protein
MLALNVERSRRVLGFEAGHHRRSAIQARTKKEITHETKIFFYALWVERWAEVCRLDYGKMRFASVVLAVTEGDAAGRCHMISSVIADDWNHSPYSIDLSENEAHVWRAEINQDAKGFWCKSDHYG